MHRFYTELHRYFISLSRRKEKTKTKPTRNVDFTFHSNKPAPLRITSKVLKKIKTL